MEVTIENSWRKVLKDEFDKPYFEKLTNFIKTEYKQGVCYPKGSEIFAALIIVLLMM